MEKAKKFKAPHLTSGLKKFTKPKLHDLNDWALFRVRFIAANPLCYACGQRARVVDHVETAKGNKDLFWKENNYIPLCKICHDFCTHNFDRHVVAKLEEKLKYLEARRLETGTNVRVKIVSIIKK